MIFINVVSGILPPRKIAPPRVRVRFCLGLALELGLGAIFLKGNFSRTVNIIIWRKVFLAQERVLIRSTPSRKEISFVSGESKNKQICYWLMKIMKLLLFHHSCFQMVKMAIYCPTKFKGNLVKHFNQQLLVFTQTFASEADYICMQYQLRSN